MKIMIFANNSAGLYKFRKELLMKLVCNHKIYLCVPDDKFIEPLASLGCMIIPCKLLDSHGTNPFKDLGLLMWYEQVLRKTKPDIVFTYTIKPNIYGGMACQRVHIPYLVNITGLGTAVENSGFIQRIALLLYKKGLKGAKKVFFQNAENRDFMVKKHIIKGPYDLLPGSGVNLNEYKVLEYPAGDIIEFAFIARIIKEKGIEQYLEAAEEIRKKYPKTVFHVCGSCGQGYTTKLNDFQKRGIIIFHGSVRNIISIYKVSSCIVLPTYYPEGLSNVLLESCASGRPIITTNRSGCREIVEDGVNVYIVKEKDSKDLICKIEKFLMLSIMERKEMGIAGRRKVERDFNREIVIKKYLAEL